MKKCFIIFVMVITIITGLLIINCSKSPTDPDSTTILITNVNLFTVENSYKITNMTVGGTNTFKYN